MNTEYTSEHITRDAVAFAKSAFGRHYIARLEAAKQRCLTDVLSLDASDSYRANRASQAAAIDAELEYFRVAEQVLSNPKWMAQLRMKAREKEVDIDL